MLCPAYHFSHRTNKVSGVKEEVRNERKRVSRMWENAYLSIKNPKASRALKQGGTGPWPQITCFAYVTPLCYVGNFWPQKLGHCQGVDDTFRTYPFAKTSCRSLFGASHRSLHFYSVDYLVSVLAPSSSLTNCLDNSFIQPWFNALCAWLTSPSIWITF